ncbi:MAG: DUF1735 domain-containing protein [Chitinophagaceae bacterium]
MKKISITLALFTAMAFAFTGCLKDKGFENGEYGINDPDTQPPGVGFPFGSKSRNDYGLDVSATTQQVNDLVYVNIEAGVATSSDVSVALTNNTAAMVTAYNAANGLTGTSAVLELPSALYNVASSITIPSGGRNAQIPVNVTNTTTLDANRLYAVGLTISAVSGGYTIAENLKNLLIVFSVKNAYDGKYLVRGRFHHPSGANPPANFTANVEMHTTGPNTVKMYWPLAGAYACPIIFGGSLNYFGGQEPEFTVNTGTNAVTVQNVAPGAVTFYAMGIGFDNAGYNSRWDPASKTFFACWGYNLGAGGSFGGNGSAARMWVDTIIRTGPR